MNLRREHPNSGGRGGQAEQACEMSGRRAEAQRVLDGAG